MPLSDSDSIKIKPKVSVFIATSLDGYIARKDGDIEWLNEANASVPKGEDCGYDALMQSVDVLVMGRKSYQKVRSFGLWPYGSTPVIVLSSNPIEFPDGSPKTIQHSSESPCELCKRLFRDGVKHIYIDGGITIQRFLSAGLVDEITITVIPVLLGDGIPLFGPMASEVALTCVAAKAYDFGSFSSTTPLQNNQPKPNSAKLAHRTLDVGLLSQHVHRPRKVCPQGPLNCLSLDKIYESH